jgi:4-azaleucine resistance transporter AzlC
MTAPEEHSDLRAGVKVGMALLLPTLAIGISFGVLAEPVMGKVAPIVMSMFVFAGAAQFAALSVLAAAGGAGPAILAGALLNLRFLPMGFAIAPVLKGGRLKRAAQGQLVVDASFAIGRRADGTFDRGRLFGATLPQMVGWIGGTVIGVYTGSALADPEALGLDVLFPAFFLALLFEEARNRVALHVAVTGALITLALMAFVPAGIAVAAASGAALIGLREVRA